MQRDCQERVRIDNSPIVLYDHIYRADHAVLVSACEEAVQQSCSESLGLQLLTAQPLEEYCCSVVDNECRPLAGTLR